MPNLTISSLIVLVSFLILKPTTANAQWSMDLVGSYSSDSFKTASTTTAGSTLFSLGVNLEAGKSKSFRIGWGISQVATTSNNGTTTTTFSSTDMGPKFMYLIDKQGVYTVSLTYNLQAQGSYNDGTGAQTLKGTSMYAYIGFTPPVRDNLFLGFYISYYAPTYIESLTGGSNYSQVSYTRTVIAPSFGLRWDL